MVRNDRPRFVFPPVRPSSIRPSICPSVRSSVHPSSKRCSRKFYGNFTKILRKFYGNFTEIVLTLKRRLWSADSGRRNPPAKISSLKFYGKFTKIVLTLERRLWSADSGRRNRFASMQCSLVPPASSLAMHLKGSEPAVRNSTSKYTTEKQRTR